MSKIKKPKVKHTLDSPFKLQWPPVEEKCAQKTIQLLIECFSGVSYGATPHRTSANNVKCPQSEEDCDVKKRLIVLGINAFTRCLERGHLRGGVVCLSAKPALLTGHILMLAATRNCPVMGLYNLSSKLAPTLGIKSVLALGFKAIEEGEVDPFHDIVSHLISCTPSNDIPWLSVPRMIKGIAPHEEEHSEPSQKKMRLEKQEDDEVKQDTSEDGKKFNDVQSNCYTPLKVKTIKIASNDKNK